MSFGLVTVQQAKWQLGLTDEQSNTEIEFRILMASSIVLDYLKIYDPDRVSPREHNDFWEAWQDLDEVPFEIKAATLLVLGTLNMHREGAQPSSFREAAPLSEPVKRLLDRWRDPAIA